MRQLWAYRFRRTTLLTLAYVSFVVGIGMVQVVPQLSLGFAAVVAVFFWPFWKKHNWLTLLLVVVVGLGAGWWRGQVYAHHLSVYDDLLSQQVTVMARAMDDGVYGRHKQLVFDADQVTLDSGRRLPGKIQLSGFGVNAVFQGDTVLATGRLRDGYGSYQASMSYATMTVTSHHQGIVSVFRQRFTAGMQTALPEPLAPFAMGLLVGQRATLPDDVKQDLLMVGLTHIIAVSGYNLTIILHAASRLLRKHSKRLSTGLSLGLVVVFLLLAGASASIVRAAIVSTLSIAAGYYGRSFKPLNLICLAAAITAGANPSYIWGDLSWYLSFLAFYGVMVLAPLIQARFPGRWQRSVFAAVALESICAEVMSLPFILHIFGQMSLVGLPANVLVVSLVPLAMLLSLVAGLAGMIISAYGGWLAWPAVWLLNYMLDVAHLLAGLPHVFVQNRSLSLGGMLSLYAVVAALTIMLQHKTKPARTAIITDRNSKILEGAAT